ncbi:MAG: galactosyltransferase-related protein [Clostridia bacterium]|nr:galactosyltransferase-related protein [Clostridia bacterium]
MFDKEISVLIPFKPDGASRSRNWEWLRKRYELLLPNAEICIGDSDIVPYCRSAGVNAAAKKATRDIFLIGDADIIFDLWQLEAAFELLSHYPWVFPFTGTHFLYDEQTVELVNKDPAIFMTALQLNGYGYYGNSLSELFFIPRKNFEKVGGFDERFRGWGMEDRAFAAAVDTLCGPHGRLGGSEIWHMCHAPTTAPEYDVHEKLMNEEYKDADTIRTKKSALDT